MSGVLAGTAIAVPAITIAAGVGKIDPTQIDYAQQYPVGSVVDIAGTTNPSVLYGGDVSNWSFLNCDKTYTVTSLTNGLVTFNSSYFTTGTIQISWKANTLNVYWDVTGWASTTTVIPDDVIFITFSGIQLTVAQVYFGAGFQTNCSTGSNWQYVFCYATNNGIACHDENLQFQGDANRRFKGTYSFTTSNTYYTSPQADCINTWKRIS